MIIFADTDVLIDHLRDKTGVSQASLLLKLVRDNVILCYLSVITIAELVVGAELTGTLTQLRQLLKLFHRKTITSIIAEHGGAIRAASIAQGREMTILDALVAATAINVGASHLVTRNVDDYSKRVAKLSVVTPTEALRQLRHKAKAFK